jgi:hypothetical protein
MSRSALPEEVPVWFGHGLPPSSTSASPRSTTPSSLISTHRGTSQACSSSEQPLWPYPHVTALHQRHSLSGPLLQQPHQQAAECLRRRQEQSHLRVTEMYQGERMFIFFVSPPFSDVKCIAYCIVLLETKYPMHST